MEKAIELVRDPLSTEDSIDGTYACVLLKKILASQKYLWKSLYEKILAGQECSGSCVTNLYKIYIK